MERRKNRNKNAAKNNNRDHEGTDRAPDADPEKVPEKTETYGIFVIATYTRALGSTNSYMISARRLPTITVIDMSRVIPWITG